MVKKLFFNAILLLGILIGLLGAGIAQARPPADPGIPGHPEKLVTLDSYAILPGQGLVFNTISDNSVSFNPVDGYPYISYYHASTHQLALASPVQSGGNCGTNNSWWCRDVTSGADDNGRYSSIAFWKGTAGAWKLGISYFDANGAGSLWFAEYHCAIGCSWHIDQIDSTIFWSKGAFNSLQYDSSGVPGISYYGQAAMAGTSGLFYAFYKVSGGNCGPSNTWQCDLIDSGGSPGMGKFTSLAVSSTGVPNISYYDQISGLLKFAQPAVTGNCGGSHWSCMGIDGGPNDVGISSAMVMDSADRPLIAYYDATAEHLKVANYIGPGQLGTNCGMIGLFYAWKCTEIDEMGDFSASEYPAIAAAYFPGTAIPLIAYEVRPLASPDYLKSASSIRRYSCFNLPGRVTCLKIRDRGYF